MLPITKLQARSNRLLAALPPKESLHLRPHLESVELTFGEILFEPGDTLHHVYFPNNSIISLLSAVEDRAHLEVGIVGNDGMAGLPVFMGISKSINRGLVQGTGTAMRMKAATLRRELGQGGALPVLLHRYTHTLL